MARVMKMLASESRASFADKIKNGNADYKWKFENGELIQEPKELWDKADLTVFNGKIRKKNDTDLEFDHIVIEGLSGNNIDEQVRVIVDSFANPDYTWDKMQTGGKFTINNVKGKRQVLYDLHDEGVRGVHLHLKVFRYSKDTVNYNATSAPMNESRVLTAQLEYTNKKLEEAGLEKIPLCTHTNGNLYNKPTLDTKLETKQVIHENKPIEEIIEDVQINSTTKEKSIISSLADDEKELVNLIQRVKNKQLEIAAKQEVMEVMENNKLLSKSVKELQEEVSKQNEIIAQKEVDIEKLQEVYKDELEEKQNHFNSIIFNKDEEIAEVKKVVEELNSELETVIEDRDNAYKDGEIKDQLLKDTSNLLEEAKEEAKSQKELAEQYKELVISQKQQLESYKEFQEQQQLQIKEQQEMLKNQQLQLLKQQEEFNKQTEEFKKLQEESKKQQEELLKTKQENTALIESNGKLANIIKQFSDVTAKMKNNYENFIVAIKSKLATSPAMKKNFNEIMQGVEKKQENIYKEFSKVANEAESQNLKIDKVLIEDNKPKDLNSDLNKSKDNKIKPE